MRASMGDLVRLQLVDMLREVLAALAVLMSLALDLLGGRVRDIVASSRLALELQVVDLLNDGVAFLGALGLQVTEERLDLDVPLALSGGHLLHTYLHHVERRLDPHDVLLDEGHSVLADRRGEVLLELGKPQVEGLVHLLGEHGGVVEDALVEDLIHVFEVVLVPLRIDQDLLLARPCTSVCRLPRRCS